MPESDVFLIGPRQGFTDRIGTLASQLTNTRAFLLSATRDLSLKQLDAAPQLAKNSIAQILAHLCAAETMFQAITFHGRRFSDAEQARWGAAFSFEPSQWTSGRQLEDYQADLVCVRDLTLREFQQRDDAWLEGPMSFRGKPANVHYYWFHYLQDEARHTGQISLLRKHLIPDAESDFNPYVF